MLLPLLPLLLLLLLLSLLSLLHGAWECVQCETWYTGVCCACGYVRVRNAQLHHESLEFARKFNLYTSETSGGWASKPGTPQGSSNALVVKLRKARVQVHRYLIQLVVLIGMDLRKPLTHYGGGNSEAEHGTLASNYAVLDEAVTGDEATDLFHADDELIRMHLKFSSSGPPSGNKIQAKERDSHLNLHHTLYVPTAVQQLQNALWPLHTTGHFEHINTLRELRGHADEIQRIWSRCSCIATTPVPLPYVQMAKVGVQLRVQRR